MLKAKWVIFSFLVLCTIPACNGYRGDGHLSHNWFVYEGDRYKLDLGFIELHKIGTYSYTMTHLPSVHFALGLEIIAAKKNDKEFLCDSKPLNPMVKVVLKNSEGMTVINEMAELRKWIWSGSSASLNESFVYRAGTTMRMHIKDNKFKEEVSGVLADEGWGTYFKPGINEEYNLIIEIVEPDRKAADYNIKLVAKN